VAGFIPVIVNISGFAQNTIQIEVNNTDVLTIAADGTGGIQTVVPVPLASFLGIALTIPTPEPLPVNLDSRPVVVANVQTVSQPLERRASLPIEAGATITTVGEIRYYELRVVTYDDEGNLVEKEEDRINLNDDRLEAIKPFNPSKLPALFGRLPADRYRIYLIEEGTERLILDFIIQGGQPVETLEGIEESGSTEGRDSPFGEDESPAEHLEVQPTAGRNNLQPRAATWPSDGDPPLTLPRSLQAGTWSSTSLPESSASFAEWLGQAPLFLHGGVIVSAAMLASRNNDRWEQSKDKLLERFGRRRRLAGFNSRIAGESNGSKAPSRLEERTK
jgi:hypothetical protein